MWPRPSVEAIISARNTMTQAMTPATRTPASTVGTIAGRVTFHRQALGLVPAARADQINFWSTLRAAAQVAIRSGNRASATMSAILDKFSNPSIRIRAGYSAILGIGANSRTRASSTAALARDN